MPKKPKIDKRLNKLFGDIQPEENVSKSRSKPQVQDEAPPSTPKPVQQKAESAATPRATRKIHTSTLVLPDSSTTTNNGDDPLSLIHI